MEHVFFLHTNDLHSHLEKWPKIRRYITERRQHLEEHGDRVIVIDLGDFIDRTHPLSEATNGLANIELMNSVHYDLATIGNNEGVGNNRKQLNHLYDDAHFPIILDNLFDEKTGQTPSWTVPYKLIETKESRIGVIALTAFFPLSYTPNNWDIHPASEILPQILQRIKTENCTTIVLMSHLGITVDREIAEAYPEISVIFSSHTHHLFINGEITNHSLIAAAGKFGQYIGEVEMLFDNNQLISTSASVISTETLPEQPEDIAEINGYLEKGIALLKEEQLATLPYTLELEEDSEHPLIFEALKAIKAFSHTSVGILNTGLFLEPLQKGIISRYDLHQCLPHPMHLLRVTLSGKDLRRLVGEIEKNRYFLWQFGMHGMGFRGKLFGNVVYDGLTYNRKNKEIQWNHEPINNKKLYTLVTVDHYMFIPFFPTIELAGKVEVISPEFIRTIVGNYLHEKWG